MHTINNLTNSPYDLAAIRGDVRLPAFGEVTDDFEPTYLQSLRDCGLYEVSGDAAPIGALDRDGNGTHSGVADSSPLTDAEEIELIGAMTDDELRDFIERKTGKKPHHKAGHDKLVIQATEAAKG